MNELVDDVAVLAACFDLEANKAINGNKAAGTRARKFSLEIEKLLKKFRKESVK